MAKTLKTGLVLKIAAYGITFALVIGLFRWTHSDRAKIGRLFREVAALLEKDGPEPVFEMSLKANKLRDYFAAECRLDIPQYDVRTTFLRDDVAGSVLVQRSGLDKLRLAFSDLETVVEGSHARVAGRVTLQTSNAAYDLNECMFDVMLVNDGRWRIVSIRGVK